MWSITMNNKQFHPIKGAFAIALTSLSFMSYFIPAQARANQPSSNSSDSIQVRFNQQEPDGSSQGRPGGRKGTGSRGSCPHVDEPLTALVPTSKLALAVEEHPTFWFYVPYKSQDVKSGEFSLQDEAHNDIYRTSFTLPGKPGVVSFKLPSTVSLKINNKYHWYFKLYCTPQKSSAPIFVDGLVQRVVLKPELTSLLKSAIAPRERIALYAKSGIWYTAATELAKLRLAEPQNATLDNDWANLLRDVGLENLVQEPIVGLVTVGTHL